MDRQLNILGTKLLNQKKFTRLAVSRHSTDSEQVVIHAVTHCAYAYRHQKNWVSRTKPRR